MDSFELRWPRSKATLYTDGIRLKIVVRDKRGPSGSINNNELCKERVAFGLEYAPELLTELKSKGYSSLAEDIEQRADSPAIPAPPRDVVGDWLDKLSGSADWEACGTKRAKVWHPATAEHALKTPASKGKQEWVLKTTSAESKPTYIVAASLKGICCALRDKGSDFFEDFLSGCAEFAEENEAVQEAIGAWRKH